MGMSNYAWICLNMLKYAGMCVNTPKFVWLASVFHVFIAIPCLLERVVTQFNEVYSLKKHGKNCFLVIFFFFRLNIFRRKISNFMWPLGTEDRGCESWYAIKNIIVEEICKVCKIYGGIFFNDCHSKVAGFI